MSMSTPMAVLRVAQRRSRISRPQGFYGFQSRCTLQLLTFKSDLTWMPISQTHWIGVMLLVTRNGSTYAGAADRMTCVIAPRFLTHSTVFNIITSKMPHCAHGHCNCLFIGFCVYVLCRKQLVLRSSVWAAFVLLHRACKLVICIYQSYRQCRYDMILWYFYWSYCELCYIVIL